MSPVIALWLPLSLVVFVVANILLRGQVDRTQPVLLVLALCLFVVGNLMNLRMMREGGLALVIGLAGVGQMVLLALVGIGWFGERLSVLQMTGLGLAVLAGILMLWPAGGQG
jgi:small multidrug resistance pump